VRSGGVGVRSPPGRSRWKLLIRRVTDPAVTKRKGVLTEKLIEASVQWAERIMRKIDNALVDGR
jgi:hypothetical protein